MYKVVDMVNDSMSMIDRIVEDMENITGMEGRITSAAVEQSSTSDETAKWLKN
jgi:methyl-accepting chemotaxis protein